MKQKTELTERMLNFKRDSSEQLKNKLLFNSKYEDYIYEIRTVFLKRAEKKIKQERKYLDDFESKMYESYNKITRLEKVYKEEDDDDNLPF